MHDKEGTQRTQLMLGRRPRITDRIGPLVIDAEALVGMVSVAIPNINELLARDDDTVDLEILEACRELVNRCPRHTIGLVAWDPLDLPWLRTRMFLTEREYKVVLPTNLKAWWQAMYASEGPSDVD